MSEDLPPGWARAKLGDLIDEASQRLDSGAVGSPVDFIGLDEVVSFTGGLTGYRRSSEIKSSANVALEGDILYGRLRPYLNKVTIAPRDCLTSGEILVFRARQGVDARFVAHLLRSPAFVDYAVRNSRGDRPRVYSTEIKEFPVAVPPENEQARIVSEIERRLSHVEAAEESLNQAMTKLAAARLSVLRSAFSGALIAPREAPGQLLEALVGSGREVRVDAGSFAWLELQDVARWASGGTPKSGTPEYYGGSIPWAVIGDLTDGVVTATAATITDDGLSNSSAKVVPAGTLLIAMYGSIGKLGIAGVAMATNQAIATGQMKDGVDVNYVFWWMMLQRSRLLAAGMGGTQSNISQTVLKPWPIPVPSTSDQLAIVTAIETRMARLEYSERLVSEQIRRCRFLRQSILAAAVRGELVPQDAGDEPAGVLLSRIYAVQSARSKSGSAGRRPTSRSRGLMASQTVAGGDA